MSQDKFDRPDSRVHAGLWGVRLRAVLWFVSGLGFLLAIPVLLDISPWLLLAIAVLAAVLALPIAALIGLVAGRRPRLTARRWMAAACATTFVLGMVAAAPVYYLGGVTALRPLAVPQVVLSNGPRTVVFQGMVHVASEAFYKAIIYEMENALAEGHVLFYEGISSSPGEGHEWFTRHLGMGESLSATYKEMGQICGLHFQNDFLSVLRADMLAHPERHVRADVSELEMKQEADRISATDPDFARAMDVPAAGRAGKSAMGIGMLGRLMAFNQRATPGQRSVEGVVCRGFMTYSLGGRRPQTAPDAMNRVILDFRNRKLAEKVLGSPQQRIFITYGSEHLRGFVAELQRADPAWHVVSAKWMRAIDAPEDLHGDLGIPTSAAAQGASDRPLPAVDIAAIKAALLARERISPEQLLEPAGFDRIGSVSITGEVKGRDAPVYVVPVAAGQRLTIRFESSGSNLHFNVLDAADESNTAVFAGETDGSVATLSAAQDTIYVIMPFQPRAQARRNEHGSYTFVISRI